MYSLFNREKKIFSAILLIISISSSSTFARDLSFITIDVAPWASINSETGEMEGAFIEIVKEISKRIDRKISVTITPFARVDRELETGSHDCTILVARPDTLVIQGDIISHHPMGVIPHKKFAIDTYEDVQSLRLSVIRGATMTPRFDEDTKIYKEYDTDYLIGLRKLSRGRLDGIVGAIPTLLYLAEQEGIDDLLGEPFALTEVPLLFQCSRNSPNLDIMQPINKAIAEMKQEGVIKQIQTRYYF